MINIIETIYNTFKDTLKKLLKLGDKNSNLFKKILFLILLNDIKEWGLYKKDFCLSNKLEEMIQLLLSQDCRFAKIRNVPKWYTSTNIPIYYKELDRVYDNKKCIILTERVNSEILLWQPDPNCTISFEPYPNEKILIGEDGKPYAIDFNSLTTCEKMQIYINRETGEAYYFDEFGNAKLLLEDQFKNLQIVWGQIDPTTVPTLYKGLEYNMQTDLNIRLTDQDPQDISIPAADSNDINNFT